MTNKKTFINPFHFVPTSDPLDASRVKEVESTLKTKPKADDTFSSSVPEMLHDRYLAEMTDAPGSFSGRIVCRLTTKTPCVFGNEHHKVKVPQSQGQSAAGK